MKRILLWIWCFPQNLVGLIVKHITKAKRKGNHYEFSIKCGSISLGEYIFLCPNHWGDRMVLRHEKGHREQSRMLGWLYLPCIALPSIIWAGIYSIFGEELEKHGYSYYWWYTEGWADELAGIQRGEPSKTKDIKQ